jgi:uncharacterized membrane protein
MGNLSAFGRICYGIGIVGMGFLTIYYADFPYMLIPPKHSWIPGLAMVSYIFGAMLILAGACIVFEKEIRTISLLLASVLLLIFCFYFIPYQLIVSSKFMQLGDWENAEKELALSGGAFVIAGCFLGKNEKTLIRFLAKLIPFGIIFFALAMISFGIDHFLYAKEAADYVPSWIPNHMFWIYFAGIPLVGSGIAIILTIRVRLIAALLGTMIFIWFIILHIPYVIASHFVDTGGEVTSAFLALAYSGIAFVIAGAAKKNS